jgi:hypothetical protein
VEKRLDQAPPIPRKSLKDRPEITAFDRAFSDSLGLQAPKAPCGGKKSAASLLDHNFVGFALHGTLSPESKATKISSQVTLHDFPLDES